MAVGRIPRLVAGGPAARSPRAAAFPKAEPGGTLEEEEAPMTFADRMKDLIDKGVAASRDLAKKAGEKAKELGAKGVLKLEIAQLEADAGKLVAKLGAEVYTGLVERKAASVSRDDPTVSELLKKIEGLRESIERKEKEFAAIGG